MFDFASFGESAATAGAGGLISSAFGALNSSINARAQRKLQQAQNAWTEKMWNMNNEYNKPVNQVARLQEAGINPALAVTNGQLQNASQGAASSGTVSAPSNGMPDVGFGDNFIHQQQVSSDIALKMSQAKNYDVDTTLKALEQEIRLATAVEEIKGRKGNYKALEQQGALVAEQLKQQIWQNKLNDATFGNMVEMSNIGVDKARIDRDIAKQQWSQQEKRFGLEIADTLASIKLKVAQRQMSLQQGRAALINAIANSDTAKSIVRYNNAKSTYQEGVNASAKSHGYFYETGKANYNLQKILADKNNEAAMDRVIMTGQIDGLRDIYQNLKDKGSDIEYLSPLNAPGEVTGSPSLGYGSSHPSRSLPYNKKSKYRYRKR